MKISPAAIAALSFVESQTATTTQPRVSLPIEFLPAEPEELNKTNSRSFELRTVPTDADSAKYKTNIRIINGSEDIRTLVQWKKDTQRVIDGFNLQGYQNQTKMIETIISGSAKQLWNNAKNVCKRKRLETRIRTAEAADRTNNNTAAMDAIRAEAGGWQHARNEHPDDVVHCVDIVMEDLLPKNVLARVKRWLRRDCRKPVTMGIRHQCGVVVGTISSLGCSDVNFQVASLAHILSIVPQLLGGTSDESFDHFGLVLVTLKVETVDDTLSVFLPLDKGTDIFRPIDDADVGLVLSTVGICGDRA